MWNIELKLYVKDLSFYWICHLPVIQVWESWQYPLGAMFLLMVFQQGMRWHRECAFGRMTEELPCRASDGQEGDCKWRDLLERSFNTSLIISCRKMLFPQNKLWLIFAT